MALKISCGVQESVGKPKFLLNLTEWIVYATGIAPIEKTTEKRNNYSFYYTFTLRIQLVDILVLFEFLLPDSVMQQYP